MSFSFKNVLVLAPHTDDAEFGCGGTIAKLLNQNADVHIATFSSCESSVPEGFPKDILHHESKAAALSLGVPVQNQYLFNYQVRIFNERRQDILQDIINLRKKINPDLVILPSLDDIHQDHLTIAQEGLRAFKLTTVLCYEMPWNNLRFESNCFVELNESNVQSKMEALKKYKSQAHRTYASEEFIRSLAITRGTQISTKFAEMFNVQRWIIK